jgi:glutathione S-transferase
MIPKRLASAHRHLLDCAARNPDLAPVYKARAEVFAKRIHTFEPDAVIRLSQQRGVEAIGFMDRMEQTLGDGRAVLMPPAYGVADVVWTVFLARMEFAGLGAEIPKRPALMRYWNAMQARPSFAAADIWTKFHIFRLIGGILGIAR